MLDEVNTKREVMGLEDRLKAAEKVIDVARTQVHEADKWSQNHGPIPHTYASDPHHQSSLGCRQCAALAHYDSLQPVPVEEVMCACCCRSFLFAAARSNHSLCVHCESEQCGRLDVTPCADAVVEEICDCRFACSCHAPEGLRGIRSCATACSRPFAATPVLVDERQ